MGILDAVDYVVVEMDGDYGMLRRLDCPQEPLKPVARAYDIFKPYLVNRGKQCQFTLVLVKRQKYGSRRLSHCFNLQNSGHNRVSGEVSVKEHLICSKIFIPF